MERAPAQTTETGPKAAEKITGKGSKAAKKNADKERGAVNGAAETSKDAAGKQKPVTKRKQGSNKTTRHGARGQPLAATSVEQSTMSQREALVPGNVWAWACCQGQVAAQLYDGSRGCQGGAQPACAARKEKLAGQQRQRRQKTR